MSDNEESSHCCEMMQTNVNYSCEVHDNAYECPDHLIFYNKVSRSYGIIIHDGGESVVKINYCPWCGKKLPKNLKDQWFSLLDELGLEPGDEKIPEEFTSDEWWKKRGL